MYEPIDLVGEPNINPDSESGVFIWRDQFNRTFVKFVAGDPLQNSKFTKFIGSIYSELGLTDLQLDSIESRDEVLHFTNKINFNLGLVKPYHDGFSFASDSEKELCIDFEKYVGGVFLGPNKVKVEPGFDINLQLGCEQKLINVDGAPTIDQDNDTGWFIWRQNDKWVNHFVSGQRGNRFIGSVVSNDPIIGLSSISIEANDVLEQPSPSKLDFQLNVARGSYKDGFQIQINNDVSNCISLIAPDDVSIYLGPDRVVMPSAFDLFSLDECSSPNIQTLGKPNFDRALDRGVFLWENVPAQWQFEFVPGSNSASVENIVIDSSENITGVQPVSIDGNDSIQEIPTRQTLSLKARSPWSDGLKFNIEAQSNSCFYKGNTAIPIFVGPNTTEVGQSFNLSDSSHCSLSYRGDVNGDGEINVSDSGLIARFAIGDDLSGTNWIFAPATGDVDCNGSVNVIDAQLVARFANGDDMSITAWCIK